MNADPDTLETRPAPYVATIQREVAAFFRIPVAEMECGL